MKTVALRSLVPAASTPFVSLDNVVVAGLLRSPTGLGESARLCAEALGDAGYGVKAIDLCRQFKVAGDITATEARPRPGPGILILHINSPWVSRALWYIGHDLVREKLIVGYWAWELEEVPTPWRDGASYVHEIWTPSRFAAAAIAGSIDRPVHLVPHIPRLPLTGDLGQPSQSAARAALGLPDRAFVAGFAFAMLSNFERKNPLAAITAFKQAFGRDRGACLILRCLDAEAYPAGLARLRHEIDGFDNIRFYGDIGTSIAAFMQACDVYLSLHRSEGFGLTLLEAMAAGRPVIATNWSGNTDFMSPQDSVLIGYRLVPVHDPQGTHGLDGSRWADPDIAAAAVALRGLRDDPDWREKMAAKARAKAERVALLGRSTLQAAIRAHDAGAAEIRPDGSPLPEPRW